MKISLAVLLVAFLLFASLDQEMAKTLATTEPNQVVDRLRSDLKNNLGRKVNVGAVNGIGKDNDISTAEEEEDSDENEAYGKTGSDPTTKSHRTFKEGNKLPGNNGQQH